MFVSRYDTFGILNAMTESCFFMASLRDSMFVEYPLVTGIPDLLNALQISQFEV